MRKHPRVVAKGNGKKKAAATDVEDDEISGEEYMPADRALRLARAVTGAEDIGQQAGYEWLPRDLPVQQREQWTQVLGGSDSVFDGGEDYA